MTRRTLPQAGFTLVETLVALFILSILSVAGGNLLLRATDAGKQVSAREAEIRALDIAQAFIRDDLEAMIRRATEGGQDFGDAQTLVGGETNRTDALIAFVRNGWINPEGIAARSSLQYVRYQLTGQGELVREAFLRPDPASATPFIRRVLLEGVESVDLTFWRGEEPSAYWEGTEVPPGNVLPDYIEMRITLGEDRTLTIASLAGGLPQ